MQSVALTDLMKAFNLKLLSKQVNITTKQIHHAEINRPALQLAGFYDYFAQGQCQIIGMVEYTYLKKLSVEDRVRAFETFLGHEIPCLVFCRSLEPFPEVVEIANKNDIPILSYDGNTTEFMGELIRYLRLKFAPQIRLHGVLVDVYGEGLLIIGESGVGKSETALELIKRGHRLVADDAVDIKRVSKENLMGSCPEVIRYFIELRGIGIIDVKQMFGVESIKDSHSIDLIIKLEYWDSEKEYERLGLEEQFMDILGNRVTCNLVPIRPGRNLAVICESAAINHRQKKMGYNAAKVLDQRVNSLQYGF